jgi:hypothetical protein
MVVRWSLGVGLVLFALGIGTSAHGEEAIAPRAGMRANIDPATGRLVPEPVAPMPQRVPAARPPAVEEPAPGGGAMVRLNGRFMSDMVATVNPDGSLRIDCVTTDHPRTNSAE